MQFQERAEEGAERGRGVDDDGGEQGVEVVQQLVTVAASYSAGVFEPCAEPSRRSPYAR